MASVRKVKEILTQEDYEYLEGVVDILGENQDTLRNYTDYSEEKIKEMIDVMLEYTTYQTVDRRLDSELEEINKLRSEAKRKYENSTNKRERDKYLNSYLDLTNKMKAIKAEKEHYNYGMNKITKKALEYDRIVNVAIDREEERRANKTSNPSRQSGTKKK